MSTASGGNSSSRAVIQAGWVDAPWLGPEVIERMRKNTPRHLLEARMYGFPSLGSGNVYPVPLEDILVDPFAIPAHWKHMYALDVGWNRTACLWAAINPDDGTIYLYSEHYQAETLPELHAAAIKQRGEWMHGVIDPAARGRAQSDGKKLFDIYRDPKGCGLKLIAANNEVESGLYNAWQMLEVGKVKVFKSLKNFQKEYMIYRRDEEGRIIKQNDHLMDCFRYIVNNIKVARQKPVKSGTARGSGVSGRNYGV
jgi:hypothetical protein